MKTGDTVYTAAGNEARVVGLDPFIIREVLVFQDWDGAPITEPGEMYQTTIDKVYPDPPVAKKAEQVERLTQKIEELRQTRARLHKECKVARTERDEEVEALEKQSKLFRNLRVVLESNVTHFVSIDPWDYYETSIYEIDELADTLKYQGAWKNQPFLKLYLKKMPMNNFFWEWEILGEYEDNKNDYLRKQGIHLCTSYEEALDILAEELRKLTTMEGKGKQDFIIDIAKKYGILDRLPNGYKEEFREKQRQQQRQKIEELQARVEKAREKLEAI